MEVQPNGVELRIAVSPPTPSDRYVPSADRLLKSVAAAVGPRSVGVILTGMGDDGVEGARAIHAAGGIVIAESPDTAVVNGMPGAAVRAGIAHKVLPLPQIAEYLSGLG
jgi:two-component system chemotaxis response regulator CheB